jgi:hypothetical protein
MEIEWKGDGVFAHKGQVTSWDEVVSSSGLAAVRRVAEVHLGPFAAIYEVDVVSFRQQAGDEILTERRITRQYLVEESTAVPRASG